MQPLSVGRRLDRAFPWLEGAAERSQPLVGRELGDGQLRKVVVEGANVLLARSESGQLCAIANTCSHLGGPLDEGSRHGVVVTCPWHGPRFDLCTGRVVEGPAVYAQPRYETRVQDGQVQVRRAQL